jgi:hypothetical protein
VNTALEKTSDAKLQYVHFVRQKGTDRYRPNGMLPDYPILSMPAQVLYNEFGRRGHLN